MRKNIFQFLMLALPMMLGLASCSDDDKPSAEEQEQQAQEQAEQDMSEAAEFWSVVGQLTDADLPESGWRTATYEPSVGTAEGNTRIVITGDLEAAAQRFADLVGLENFSATTDSYVYESPLVGRLSYSRVNDGSALAQVEVSIPLMPHLSKIIYRSPEQADDNAYFPGTAYYRFGDVVEINGFNWICVRPSFGPAKKGDSHWISFNNFETRTTKKRINGKQVEYILPRSLATNMEHMQNLAELIYAMMCSETWASNLSSNWKKLKYFTDFNYDNLYKYNNSYFFEKVYSWLRWYFGEAVFRLDKEAMLDEIAANGLTFVYGTPTISGSKVYLPMVTFSGDNLKTKTTTKYNFDAPEGFDIWDQLRSKGYLEFKTSDGKTRKAWCVTYAKCTKLTSDYDVYKSMGFKDKYLYNLDEAGLDLNNLPNIEPEVRRW